MAPTLIASPGASNANSYEEIAEADAYFEGRLPLTPPWDEADSKAVLLIMATRSIDAMFRGQKVLIRGDDCGCASYTVRRSWKGTPASSTQKLAWPRLGLTDQNGHPLDFQITNIEATNPAKVTTTVPHGLTSGQSVFITGSNSTPLIDGSWVITVFDSTSFTIPIPITIPGTVGHVSIIPQDLKDAVSEFAGQLQLSDRILDSDVSTQGITSARAGSVAVSFRNGYIDPKVVPDAVVNLLSPMWYTEELYEPAQKAVFEILG